VVVAIESSPPDSPLAEQPLPREFERARWFPLPSEGLLELEAARRTMTSSHRERS
jgi:hypothetical protein